MVVHMPNLLCLPAHTAMVLFDPDAQGVYTEELATWLIEAVYYMACNINTDIVA